MDQVCADSFAAGVHWFPVMVRRIARLLFLAVFSATLLALAVAPASSGSPRLVEGYFNLRPDPRLCPSPVCGGVFASLLNRPLTPCPAAAASQACHASTVDWSRIDLDPQAQADFEAAALGGRAVVRGELSPGDVVDGFGTLGKLVVTEGWIAASSRRPRGGFFRVAPNGIVCFATPCFSLRESLLNTSFRGDVSGLDLSGAGAPQALRDAAWRELARGSILVAGRNRVVPDPGPAGHGLNLVATQFYLRVGSRPPG